MLRPHCVMKELPYYRSICCETKKHISFIIGNAFRGQTTDI